MTFSIAARSPESGMFGVAVCSSSPAVAARCAHARAAVGAATSQNVTDPALGPAILDLMAGGQGARKAVEEVAKGTQWREYRQLTAVDHRGGSFVYTGSGALGVSSGCAAEDVACAGNLLADKDIPEIMVQAFQLSEGHLADRIIETMKAALRAGGEEGPVHSAGLKIVHEVSWPIVDLRIDWTDECPIEQLAKLWSIYAPQVEDYIARAATPGTAPSYGVPGDD